VNDQDAVTVRTLVELGRSLGLRTVAEGVESPDAREMLREYGCQGGQGYLFSRPVPAEHFLPWIARQPVRHAGVTAAVSQGLGSMNGRGDAHPHLAAETKTEPGRQEMNRGVIPVETICPDVAVFERQKAEQQVQGKQRPRLGLADERLSGPLPLRVTHVALAEGREPRTSGAVIGDHRSAITHRPETWRRTELGVDVGHLRARKKLQGVVHHRDARRGRHTFVG